MKFTVGFSKSINYPNRLCSQLISLVEKTPFSHVYVRWEIPSIPGLVIVYQAGHGFLHFCEFELFKKHNEIVTEFTLEVSDAQYKQVLEYCLRHAGVKYGTLQLVGMGLNKLLHLRSPFKDKETTMVCSELVAHLLNVLGMEFSDYDQVSPSNLYELLKTCKSADCAV